MSEFNTTDARGSDNGAVDVFVPTDQDILGPASSPDEDDDEASADPFAIKALKLPSGARVEFRSMSTVTQANVRWMREALNADGNGAFLNDVLARGMQLLITSWELSLPLPRDNPKIIDKLSYADANAIERRIMPHLVKMVNPAGGGSKGE